MSNFKFLGSGLNLIWSTGLFLILNLNQAFATDYYFSSVSGKDSRTAIQAQNPSTPWKTIAKLNSIAGSLKPNDRILFKSGETFYGTIQIQNSGNLGNPIKFLSYGEGDKPIITSMAKIDNWVSLGGGIYQADLSKYNLSQLQILLLNGEIQEVGRFPNSDAENGGFLSIAATNGSNWIGTKESNPYSGAGGEIVIRKNNWVIDRHKISAINGSSITFQNPSNVYVPQAGLGYFLQNHSSLLDKPGEWAYDSNTKLLTINLSGYSLSTVEVEVATLGNLITNKSYTGNFSFSNLRLIGANSDLILLSKSENVIIENCVLEYAGRNSINSLDAPNLIIRNNQINTSLNNGIFLFHGSPDALISNNMVFHTMPFKGMSQNSDLNGIAIFLGSDGNNSIIEKNKVQHVGYSGIHFGGDYTKVKNNLVSDFCLYKQDGGGIYTNSDGFRDRNNKGREIVGNIILKGKGDNSGTFEEVEMAEGIYLDDNSSGVKVADNTIAYVSGKGVFLHNANNIEITNNLFYKIKSQVQFTHDFMGDPIRNINVHNNRFSSLDASEYIYSIFSKLDDLGQVGVFNTNYFLDPFDNEFFIHTKAASSGSQGEDRNLENWSSSFGYDVNSKKTDISVPSFEIVSSSTIKESKFNDASIVAGIYSATGTITSNGIEGSSYLINPNSSNSATVYIQLGPVQAEEDLLVTFDMKSSISDIPIELFLEGTFNLDKGEGNKIVATKVTGSSYEVLLSSKAYRSNESLVFRLPSNAKNVYLDNLTISKVEVVPVNKEDKIIFEYNFSSSAIQFPIQGNYIDARNQVYTGSVYLAPYSSVLLVKTSDEALANADVLPSVSIANPINNQVFTLGDFPVEIIANASVPEENIRQVEFYSNEKLLASVTNSPFTYTLENGDVGMYQIYAKVTDFNGLSSNSEIVNFSIEEPPVSNDVVFEAKMVTPFADAKYNLGEETVILKTNVNTSQLDIKQIEYFNWGFPLVSVAAAPFDFAWTRIEVGDYKVSAKITDSKGDVYLTDDVKFSVQESESNINLSRPQGITLVQPFDGHIYTLGKEEVILQVEFPDISNIAKVQYYNWGFPLVATSNEPFDFNWSKIELGDYKVYAEVTDLNGNVTTTNTVKFSVSDQLQISSLVKEKIYLKMVSPYDNQVIELGNNGVTLKAQTNAEVSQVNFYNWFLPLVSVADSNLEFDWTKIEVGDYLVYAEIKDSNGNVIQSDPISFKVVDPNAREKKVNDPNTSNNLVELKNDGLEKSIGEIGPSNFGIIMGPNPAQDKVKIFFDGYPSGLDAEISLFSLSGNINLNAKANTDDSFIELDISSLKQGVYVVQITFGEKYVQTKKLIKY